MTRYKRTPFPFLLLLLFGADKGLANYCPDDELYVIRATGSSGLLVLDGSEPPQILLQYFTGFSPQLWQFKRGSRAGLFYIINKHTGNPLEFVKSDNRYKNYLVMRKKKDALEQQWSLNVNGRIVNAATGRTLDVFWGNFTSSNPVILYEDNGTVSQQFDLQLIGVRPNLDWCKYLLR